MRIFFSYSSEKITKSQLEPFKTPLNAYYRVVGCENAIGIMTKLQNSLAAEETWVDGTTEKLTALPTATSALELDVSTHSSYPHRKKTATNSHQITNSSPSKSLYKISVSLCCIISSISSI